MAEWMGGCEDQLIKNELDKQRQYDLDCWRTNHFRV